jgi:hypothetical protein
VPHPQSVALAPASRGRGRARTEAIAIREAEGKTSTTLYSSALNTASNALDALDRKREALVYQGRITALLERIGRDRTAAMGVNLHNQALTLWDLGRWRDADETYRRALGIVGGFDRRRFRRSHRDHGRRRAARS